MEGCRVRQGQLEEDQQVSLGPQKAVELLKKNNKKDLYCDFKELPKVKYKNSLRIRSH